MGRNPAWTILVATAAAGLATGGAMAAGCRASGQGSPAERCDNGQDDDGNGLVDCADPACDQAEACRPCNRDGRCDFGERYASCPQDCAEACGNGRCDPGEQGSCPTDCGAGDCSTFPDLVTQQACGGDAACDLLDLANTVGCREAGDASDYAPCDAPTDCGAGATCVELAGGELFCAPFCNPILGRCPGEGRCDITVPGVTGVQLCGLLALDACDVVTASGCEPGQGCYLADTEGGTLCLAAGAGIVGAPCTWANDCAAGLGCFGNGTGDQCLRQCHTTADCGVDSCQSMGQVLPGHPDVGLCLP